MSVNERIKTATACLWSIRGTQRLRLGTAWLISREYALTAAHCLCCPRNDHLEKLDFSKLLPGTFELEFPWGTVDAERGANADDWLEFSLDVALLKIPEGKVPDDLQPILLSPLPPDSRDPPPRPWCAWAFPDAHHGLSLEIYGNIINRDVPIVADSRGLQMDCTIGGMGGLNGASGAAVIHRNQAVGLVRYGPPDLRQKVVMATRIDDIVAHFPAVKEILDGGAKGRERLEQLRQELEGILEDSKSARYEIAKQLQVGESAVVMEILNSSFQRVLEVGRDALGQLDQDSDRAVTRKAVHAALPWLHPLRRVVDQGDIWAMTFTWPAATSTVTEILMANFDGRPVDYMPPIGGETLLRGQMAITECTGSALLEEGYKIPKEREAERIEKALIAALEDWALAKFATPSPEFAGRDRIYMVARSKKFLSRSHKRDKRTYYVVIAHAVVKYVEDAQRVTLAKGLRDSFPDVVFIYQDRDSDLLDEEEQAFEEYLDLLREASGPRKGVKIPVASPSTRRQS